jgi:ArsR family transcriptional regulator
MYYLVMATLSISKSPKSIAKIADQLKALGDQTRLELIIEVAKSDNKEACVCNLTPGTGLSQGTVSHHLKLLQEVGLLEREQRGKWAYFSLTPSAITLLLQLEILK